MLHHWLYSERAYSSSEDSSLGPARADSYSQTSNPLNHRPAVLLRLLSPNPSLCNSRASLKLSSSCNSDCDISLLLSLAGVILFLLFLLGDFSAAAVGLCFLALSGAGVAGLRLLLLFAGETSGSWTVFDLTVPKVVFEKRSTAFA